RRDVAPLEPVTRGRVAGLKRRRPRARGGGGGGVPPPPPGPQQGGPKTGAEVPAQRFLVVVVAHPIQEGLRAAPRRFGVEQEEGVEDAGAALADVAVAERELRQRRFRRAAVEQQPDAGGEAGPVGAGL